MSKAKGLLDYGIPPWRGGGGEGFHPTGGVVPRMRSRRKRQ